ncbi:MAG: hypothetical protein HYZ74_04210, partial [Elusimicrobia bacterium]|nr:hypothetical protein [Elusimicrobiota bacterium]
LAERNIRVPATRAFMMPAHRFLKRGKIPSSPTVQAMGVPRTRAEVRRAVVEFLQRYKGPEVVVKPSGARFHSGEGVDFFGRERVDDITDYVIKLSKHAKMEGQGAVLLEQRLAPPPIYLRFSEYTGSGPFVYRDKKKLSVRVLAPSEIATAADHEKKDYNQRVYAVRTPSDDGYAVPMTFFRAGTWGLPTSSQPNNPDDAAAVISFETMLEAWRTQHGLMMSAADVQAFEKQRDEMGRAAMLAIMANEKKLRRKKGDAYQGQTDMIGLDAMYQVEDGKLVKYYIEVNDHDAAGQHALDLFYPDRAGEHSASWIDLGLWRARHSQP